MNVNTIIIPREEAERKLEQYRSIIGKRRLAEDDKLEQIYKRVSQGARVLNLAAAFKQTGLNELKQPKLAIARADWKEVFCSRWSMPGPNWGVKFSDVSDTWRNYSRNVNIPLDAQASALFDSRLSSPVPHIPPDCRPKFGLHNYHILFEVGKWMAYPVDPFLLRRISGMLFVVEAEWELTELEASLLSSLIEGN